MGKGNWPSAADNDIRNAGSIIEEVAKSLAMFGEYAEQNSISQPWRGIIQKTISDNLTTFGYLETENKSKITYIDNYRRTVDSPTLSVNSKGHYELSAIIDGTRRRRFIRPNMIEYQKLHALDIYQMSTETMQNLIETLLPPE